MISVLTLTYQRKALLEEAIYSFLLQDIPDTEMVIVNDCPAAWYEYYHPRIRIDNLSERFSSLGAKLAYGFAQCRYPYVYRLDDDDLLAPCALRTVRDDITAHPGYDVYRSREAYLLNGAVLAQDNPNKMNTGNVYAQSYVQRVAFPDISYGEDQAITFEQGARVYTADHAPTMIYRLGLPTYNLSVFGFNVPNERIYRAIEPLADRTAGRVVLAPHFAADYWAMLPKEG